MSVFDQIPLENVIQEIKYRQGMAWNSYINSSSYFPYLNILFELINSGVPAEDFFYKGNLFRIHCAYCGLANNISDGEEIISNICEDDSCHILKSPEYNEKIITSFTKNFDFWNHQIWYKVCSQLTAYIFYIDTGSKYGIDINALFDMYGIEHGTPNYPKENEVLFPLDLQHIKRIYKCTPNQFKYYMRGRR